MLLSDTTGSTRAVRRRSCLRSGAIRHDPRMIRVDLTDLIGCVCLLAGLVALAVVVLLAVDVYKRTRSLLRRACSRIHSRPSRAIASSQGPV